MLNVSGNVFIKTPPTAEEGKDFASCLIRDGKNQYKCYFFDDVKDKVLEKGYKGGDFVSIVAIAGKSKPKFLISPKKWNDIAPGKKNPTLFAMPYLQIVSMSPAIPEELEKRYENKIKGKRKVIKLEDIA